LKKINNMDKQNNEETYLLFVFGDFTTDSKVYDVGQSIILTSSDETIKYIYGSYHMVLKITTDIPFDEFKQFIFTTLKEDTYEYFLMPYSEKSSVKLPKKLAENLFDLDEENENVRVMDIPTLEEVERQSKQGDDELDKLISYFTKDMGLNFEMEDEEVDPMMFKKVIEPTMNEILDNMVESGVESLTLEDKRLLEKYANEYK
tara:strand:+ start:286 stop:894 length:609 start_codon:yes stop_codon:yes gene_type:complete